MSVLRLSLFGVAVPDGVVDEEGEADEEGEEVGFAGELGAGELGGVVESVCRPIPSMINVPARSSAKATPTGIHKPLRRRGSARRASATVSPELVALSPNK